VNQFLGTSIAAPLSTRSQAMSAHRWLVLVLAIVCAALMACGGSAPGRASVASSVSSSAIPKVTSLKATYTSISAHQLAMYVAADAGLWKKEGLNVELIYSKSTATALPALTTGEIEFALTNGPDVTSAMVKGAPLTFVAGGMPKYDFGVYAKGNVASLEDLAGKTVAVTKPGSSTEHALKAALSYYKMKPDAVKILYAGGVPDSLAAVITAGVADAAVLSPPTNVQAEKAGLKQMVYVGDLPIRFLDTGLVANRDFIQQHPNAALAFIRGYLAAIGLLKRDKQQAESALAHYAKIDDRDALDAGYVAAAKLYDPKPLLTPDDVRGALEEGGELAAAQGDVSRFYDNSFVQRLTDSGFISSLSN